MRRIESYHTHKIGTSRRPAATADLKLDQVGSRRWFTQTGIAGLAGLSLPDLCASPCSGDGPRVMRVARR